MADNCCQTAGYSATVVDDLASQRTSVTPGAGSSGKVATPRKCRSKNARRYLSTTPSPVRGSKPWGASSGESSGVNVNERWLLWGSSSQ